VALTPPTERNSAGVGALWARAKIASLMDTLAQGADVAQVRPAVLRVALEHHLVSAYTSLVAVDVTPTNPDGSVKTAMVKASLPQGYVGGTLPQTDTPALLQMLLGLFALSSAAFVAFLGRNAPRPA
jgi:Ca-activated chloride channel family protein